MAQGRFRSERTKDKGATADRGDDGTMSRLLGGSDDGGEVMMMLKGRSSWLMRLFSRDHYGAPQVDLLAKHAMLVWGEGCTSAFG